MDIYPNEESVVECILDFMFWKREQNKKEKMMQSMLNVIAMVFDKIFFGKLSHSSHQIVERLLLQLRADWMLSVFKHLSKKDRIALSEKLEKRVKNLERNHWNQGTRNMARDFDEDYANAFKQRESE